MSEANQLSLVRRKEVIDYQYTGSLADAVNVYKKCATNLQCQQKVALTDLEPMNCYSVIFNQSNKAQVMPTSQLYSTFCEVMASLHARSYRRNVRTANHNQPTTTFSENLKLTPLEETTQICHV